jgi:hypothetical protein
MRNHSILAAIRSLGCIIACAQHAGTRAPLQQRTLHWPGTPVHARSSRSERGIGQHSHTHHVTIPCPQASFADAANWRGAAQPGGKRELGTCKAAWGSPAGDKEGSISAKSVRASRPSRARACAPSPQTLSASTNLHSRAEVTATPTTTWCGRAGRICAAAHPLTHWPGAVSMRRTPVCTWQTCARAAAALAHQKTQSKDVAARSARKQVCGSASPATFEA